MYPDYLKLSAYEPGDKLKEAELSRNINISRSTVREPIQSQANGGFICLIPQRGAFVFSFDPIETKVNRAHGTARL